MEDDEETLCRYGTALPPFEEDAVPSKKPILVEDQIVLDSNGKRRFHGAFTGGFSAGYWNTVGSEEGWKPREFKSSRNEKSSTRTQNPMDFMDEEDLGEFGFAPQRVQARDDFAHSKCSSSGATGEKANKRKFDMGFPKGPIPGQPVLGALLEPAKEKTAVKMLRRMGWREGQGIGERQTRTEKKRTKERNSKEQYTMKTYGCEIPGNTKILTDDRNNEESSEDSDSDYDVTFAPDDFDPLVAALKANNFGLGYSGLDRGSSNSFNLFDTFEVVDKNNKKLSIRGQAFGIGALEEDDDLDVYARDDMSRYDFSLEDGNQTKKNPAAIKTGHQGNGLEGFCHVNIVQKVLKKVFRSQMPEGFKPRNWAERKSRFDTMDEERSRKIHQENEHKIRGLGRHDLGPKERGELLGEKQFVNSAVQMINNQSSNFVPEKLPSEADLTGNKKIKEQVEDGKEKEPVSSSVPKGLLKQSKILLQQYVGSTKDGFKPFIAYPDKQERYEQFLVFQPTERYLTREQYLESLQPLNLSAWDRERELKEFLQAERMYRPLDGLMLDRFVTASSLIADKIISSDGSSDPPEVKMKRTCVMWAPHKDLCKRFNVPEPFGGMMLCDEIAAEKQRKDKAKFSVFDYLEAPVTNRRDFVTPVIIPSGPPPAKDPSTNVNVTDGQRVSSKEFFVTDDSFERNQDYQKGDHKASNTNVEQVPPKVLAKKVEKKRSELEEKVLEATNKKPEEKRDLFKSIFCSSDEENEQGDEPADTKGLGVTLTVEEKIKMVESVVAIKPASQVNILRNNSPPRGIFKSLFEFKRINIDPSEENTSSKIEKHVATDPADVNEKRINSTAGSNSESGEKSDSLNDPYYGPKLPKMETKRELSYDGQQQHVADKLQHLLGEGDAGSTRKQEVWIEKISGRAKKKKHKEHHHKSKSKSKKTKKKSSHKHKSKR